MTEVIYEVGKRVSLSIEGHTGYINPETQNNDLCVAVSTLTIMLVRYCDRKGIYTEVADGIFRVEAEGTADNRLIVGEVVETLKWLQQEYPQYIKVGAR